MIPVHPILQFWDYVKELDLSLYNEEEKTHKEIAMILKDVYKNDEEVLARLEKYENELDEYIKSKEKWLKLNKYKVARRKSSTKN